MIKRNITLAIVAGLGLVALAGCGEKTTEEKMKDDAGAMQKDMQKAVDDATDAAKDATDGK